MTDMRTALPDQATPEDPEGDPLEQLIPDELPELLPSHPDDFDDEDERKGNDKLPT
jgi:hypothetical protein